MNRRTGPEMIFIPLLCLLLALIVLVFAQVKRNDVLPPQSEVISLPGECIPYSEISSFMASIEVEISCIPVPSEEMEEIFPAEDLLCPLTNEEVELIALLTMAEAEGECEYGQRLVIDSVLNRVDSEHFPNTVHGVVYQKNQYSSMTSERVAHCRVKNELCELVRSELKERTDYDVVFFRTKHYHPYGTPLRRVGAHYFSKYG